MEDWTFSKKGFALVNSAGEPLVQIKVRDTGDPLVVMNDKQGNGMIELMVTDGCPSIRLWYAPMPRHIREKISITVGNTGEVFLDLIDTDKQVFKRLDIDKLPWYEYDPVTGNRKEDK